jgi:hypothetical protein
MSSTEIPFFRIVFSVERNGGFSMKTCLNESYQASAPKTPLAKSARRRDLASAGRVPWFAGCYPAFVMEAKGLTPILNVSDIASTVAWFEKWGWKKLWDWGTPPTFGAVGSGKDTCIFLCQGAQGGRGRGANTTTFQQDGDEEGDKGVWMSVWVDDVDQMHRHCVAAGLEVTFPPTNMPWHVREMHLRHPDGHVFRVGKGFEPKE